MSDPKVIWAKEDANNSIELTRHDTSYSIMTSDFVETTQAPLTREELRDLFLALKRELGLAGD